MSCRLRAEACFCSLFDAVETVFGLVMLLAFIDVGGSELQQAIEESGEWWAMAVMAFGAPKPDAQATKLGPQGGLAANQVPGGDP